MATQLGLFKPPPPPAPPPLWGLIVDEIRLFAMGRGTTWWVREVGHLNAAGRIRYLAVTPQGSVLEVGPFEQDDAEFVRDYLTEKGIDARVLKLRKWTEHPHLPKCRPAKRCRLCSSADVAHIPEAS